VKVALDLDSFEHEKAGETLLYLPRLLSTL
jgi:hypothetical protein